MPSILFHLETISHEDLQVIAKSLGLPSIGPRELLITQITAYYARLERPDPRVLEAEQIRRDSLHNSPRSRKRINSSHNPTSSSHLPPSSSFANSSPPSVLEPSSRVANSRGRSPTHHPASSPSIGDFATEALVRAGMMRLDNPSCGGSTRYAGRRTRAHEYETPEVLTSSSLSYPGEEHDHRISLRDVLRHWSAVGNYERGRGRGGNRHVRGTGSRPAVEGPTETEPLTPVNRFMNAREKERENTLILETEERKGASSSGVCNPAKNEKNHRPKSILEYLSHSSVPCNSLKSNSEAPLNIEKEGEECIAHRTRSKLKNKSVQESTKNINLHRSSDNRLNSASTVSKVSRGNANSAHNSPQPDSPREVQSKRSARTNRNMHTSHGRGGMNARESHIGQLSVSHVRSSQPSLTSWERTLMIHSGAMSAEDLANSEFSEPSYELSIDQVSLASENVMNVSDDDSNQEGSYGYDVRNSEFSDSDEEGIFDSNLQDVSTSDEEENTTDAENGLEMDQIESLTVRGIFFSKNTEPDTLNYGVNSEKMILSNANIHKDVKVENMPERLCCTVCMDIIQNGDGTRTLPCFHIYHTNCVDPWLRRHGRCPLCKSVLD